MIPTGVLIPVVSMSRRFLIGIDHMLATPGVLTVAFASLTIESYVTPRRQSFLSLRVAIVSIIDIGAMSVAVSARPIFPITVCTSGILARAASRCWRICFACAVPTPGNSDGMSIMLPSLSGGMNSLPSRDKGTSVIMNAIAAPMIVCHRCRSTKAITGR